MTEMQHCHSNEMQTLQKQMHQKNEAAFKKYRMAVEQSLNKPESPVVTNEQVILYNINSNILCSIFMPLPGQTFRWRHRVLDLSLHLSVHVSMCPSVCLLQNN